MPVNAMPVQTILQLVLHTGTDANGEPVLRTRSYRSVKTGAPDADVYDVGVAIAGLQVYPLSNVQRVNKLDLVSV